MTVPPLRIKSNTSYFRESGLLVAWSSSIVIGKAAFSSRVGSVC